jgi:hypothetical protein
VVSAARSAVVNDGYKQIALLALLYQGLCCIRKPPTPLAAALRLQRAPSLQPDGQDSAFALQCGCIGRCCGFSSTEAEFWFHLFFHQSDFFKF